MIVGVVIITAAITAAPAPRRVIDARACRIAPEQFDQREHCQGFKESFHFLLEPQLAAKQQSAPSVKRPCFVIVGVVGLAANLRAEVVAPRADGQAGLEIAAEMVREERCSAGFPRRPELS